MHPETEGTRLALNTTLLDVALCAKRLVQELLETSLVRRTQQLTQERPGTSAT